MCARNNNTSFRPERSGAEKSIQTIAHGLSFHRLVELLIREVQKDPSTGARGDDGGALGMTRGECSELLYESLVIGVGADPKPDYYVLISDAEGAPADTYPYGIRLVFSADSFELQAGVVCIVLPELVAAAGGALDVIGKSPKTFQKVVGQV